MDPNAQQNVPDDPVAPAPPELKPDQPIAIAPQPSMCISAHNPGYSMGIVSLVLCFVGLAPVGIILGFIALLKSKKSGHSNIFALLGVIFGVVNSFALVIGVGLILNDFQITQKSIRDTGNGTRVSSLGKQLEIYHDANNGYPANVEPGMFKNIEARVFETYQGNAVKSYNKAISKSEALAQSGPTESDPYQYIAYGCDTDNLCDGYFLRVLVERPRPHYKNPLVHTGLYNK